LGEELPEKERDGRTPFSPRCLKDMVEEQLFAHRRDLLTRLDLVFMDTTEDEQKKVARVIVVTLESHNWRIEQGPPRKATKKMRDVVASLAEAERERALKAP
jgi:hypothetical protein